MTNHLADIQKSKAIIIFGANPAVNHPVGFQHFLKAKEINGSKLIVIDPRFTRTAAKADMFIQIRGGTDIAFMYGMINLIIENGWADTQYINERTFGFEEIKKEAQKYTPDVVANVCGVDKKELLEVTKLYANTKPGTLIWAMGLTQHSIGTGNTRLAPILQLILGNIGISGGGTNILRGHDNVQGATDVGCNADSLPGYYGLSEGAFKHWSDVWGIDYDWIKSRFSPDMMDKNGFTLARWWQGVLQEDDEKIHNGKSNKIRSMMVMGNGIISVAQTSKVKEALDNLELFIMIDPFPHDAIAYTDKKDGVYLLPGTTQFEVSGSVTATNRSGQWRYRVIEPIYESKPDQEILFALARKLGFYEEYTKSLYNIAKKYNRTQFQWPEDATRELNIGMKTIGLSGWTPERLKSHTDNWGLFDTLTLKGFGPMQDQYYGLPWPCWNQNHPGTPNLYDEHLPVSEGGSGFRQNFGLTQEINGKTYDMLAAKNSFPPKSNIKGGYPEITADNIEKLIGKKLSNEEKKIVQGKNWKTDLSMILVNKALEAGLCPFGNGRARMYVGEWIDKVPTHREPIHTPRPDLIEKYPTYADKSNHWRVDTKYQSLQKDYTKEFPIQLNTARLVTHNGQGIEARVSLALSEINPEMFINLHPNTAANLGLQDGDMVWVYSPEGGKAKIKLKLSFSIKENVAFAPFHWAGIFRGKNLSQNYPQGYIPYSIGENINGVTNYGYDIVTQIPETKCGLCRIEKA
ncbi:formate dehydrogenase [Helicobacter sp. 13S00477-4]|nr:formate dehydrogenase [Helicobacter sp. 13S00477-4]